MKGIDLIQDAVERGIARGVRDTLEILQREKRQSAAARYDKRLRNTNLLLRNYKNFIEHCKNAVWTEEKIREENVIDIFDSIENIEDDETIIQSILKSKKRTEIIIKHIETCLNFYLYECASSSNQEKQRRGQVAELLYIKCLSYDEISNELFISAKTVNRDRKRAVEEIAVIIFGVDGIKLDF